MAAPAGASASTLRLITTCAPGGEGCQGLGLVKQAVYRTQGLEVNEVSISLTDDGAGLVVTDPGAVIASSDGCVTDPSDPHRATCRWEEATLSGTDLELGPFDDSLRVAGVSDATDERRSSRLSVTARGGEGGDTLTAGPGRNSLVGGAGDDTLTGGEDFDFLAGEGGDDQLDGRAGDDGLAGGRGADTLVGGDGHDRVSYFEHAAGVHVDLEGDRDDGEAGEGDLVDASIERASGGRGSDEIIGDERDNLLDGGARGNDLLVGAGGDDYLQVSPYLSTVPDRAFGGDGNDRLEGGGELDGGDGNDRVMGNYEADLLAGGEGDDQLSGAGARDRIDGGPGNDGIDARLPPGLLSEPDDRDPGDWVECGRGQDIAFPSDDVLSNCEQLAVRVSCRSRANCVASGVLSTISRPRQTVGGGRMRLGYADRKLVVRLSDAGRGLLERRRRLKVRNVVTVRAWNYRPRSRPDEPNRRGRVSTFRSTYRFTLAADLQL